MIFWGVGVGVGVEVEVGMGGWREFVNLMVRENSSRFDSTP